MYSLISSDHRRKLKVAHHRLNLLSLLIHKCHSNLLECKILIEVCICIFKVFVAVVWTLSVDFFSRHTRFCTICTIQKAKACNFTNINTPPWVFFTFFKLCKWYQIVQSITVMVLTKELRQYLSFSFKTIINFRR